MILVGHDIHLNEGGECLKWIKIQGTALCVSPANRGLNVCITESDYSRTLYLFSYAGMVSIYELERCVKTV